MKKIMLLPLLIVLLGTVFGQSYSDGCMQIDLYATMAWNEEYEDPIANDETNWQWWFADEGDFDAAGWVGGVCLAQGGFYQIGWWNHADVLVFSHNYSTATVPRTFALRGHFEGDDCGGSCDYCTSLFDDDDYRYDETVATGIDYRAYGPPNSSTNYFTRFTTTHGGSDFGGEFYAVYTSPKPTATPSATQICDDGSTSISLALVGAIYGGTYEIYRDGTFLASVSGSTYAIPSQTISRTYTVYTRNGGVNSNCYAQFSISAVNCDFNCSSSGQVTAGSVASYTDSDPTATGTYWSTTAYSGTSIFPVNSYITDIDVQVRFNSGTASCADLELTHMDAATVSTSLIISSSGINSFTPTTFVNNTANTQWRLFGDNTCASSYAISWYQVDVCACKTANYGFASVNGSTSGITICADDPNSISLSHNGATSALSNNGYGDELRWYTNSNASSGYVGSGNPLILPSPSTTTTYYCWYFVDGVRCRSNVGSSSTDEEVTVTVTPLSDAGSLLPSTQTICVNTTASALSLSGYVGSVQRWEYSADGGGSWSTISPVSTATSFTPGTAYTTAAGTHSFRAVVQNGSCDEVYTSLVTLIVNPNPVAGSVAAPVDTLCTGNSFFINANAYSGSIQWQVSSVGPSSGFTDIAGATSPTYSTSLTNAGTTPMSRWYRTEITNTPCLTPVYSSAVRIVIDPVVVAGTITADQNICLGEGVADIVLSGNNAAVIHWEVANNVAFTSPNTITTTATTLSGTTVDAILSGNTGVQLYVRAIVENTCSQENTNVVIIRYNQPEPIVMADATGTCEANFATSWVHIYDPATSRIICSVNDFGQNLGDVTASVFYHGGAAFTVAANGSCAQQQGVLNRSFVLNSVNNVNLAIPVGIRLYFTDAELTDLISVAGCGDVNGCADNDDVCSIADLVVTQIHGLTPSEEDGVFVPGAGTAILHSPANSGTGNSNFGANYVQFTVREFSEFWIHGSESGVTLPVELLDFTAKVIDNASVHLEWSTATEINNDRFEIERSIDGVDFSTIGSVQGHGNSSMIQNYSWMDNAVESGYTYYYRLNQIDFNGENERSEIRMASLKKKLDETIGFFVPNPSENESKITIESVSDHEAKITFFDAFGRTVAVQTVLLHTGSNVIYCNTEKFASGVYTAKINIEKESYSRKLVIRK